MMPSSRKREYTGPFAALAQAFIQYKRSLGYAYETEDGYMRRFCAWAPPSFPPILTKDIVLQWCERSETEGVLTQRQRKRVIRQFGRYLDMVGYDAFIIPKAAGKTTQQPYVPYIFTREEIARLFVSIDELMGCSYAHGRFMHPLLIRMLYGCGLRVSEAAGLQARDGDLERGILTIRSSKFGKDRLVPMSASLTNACRIYAEKHFIATSVCFFPSPDGDPYDGETIYWHFRHALEKSGIPHMGKGRGPRLHDLRHTFAVHCLERWTAQGNDLYAMLPVLAAYLGHDSIQMTQKYLHMTHDAYSLILSLVEKACEGVIPKVEMLL